MVNTYKQRTKIMRELKLILSNDNVKQPLIRPIVEAATLYQLKVINKFDYDTFKGFDLKNRSDAFWQKLYIMAKLEWTVRENFYALEQAKKRKIIHSV